MKCELQYHARNFILVCSEVLNTKMMSLISIIHALAIYCTTLYGTNIAFINNKTSFNDTNRFINNIECKNFSKKQILKKPYNYSL